MREVQGWRQEDAEAKHIAGTLKNSFPRSYRIEMYAIIEFYDLSLGIHEATNTRQRKNIPFAFLMRKKVNLTRFFS